MKKDYIFHHEVGFDVCNTEEPHYRTIWNLKEFIEKNAEDHLDLNILANEAGISKFYLQRLYKKIFGISPIKYLIEWRIKRAVEMIHQMNRNKLSITEIGIHSGFNSLSAFSKAFKKHTGYSPLNYKKML